jgi:dolichyl-phosphate-mannose--protein O-mannosyl transferase
MKCNSVIRLEHANTGKNLHSHNFPSYITDSQEACGFGERGTGDVNDNFRIICYNSKDDKLKGSTQFFLQHEATKQFLYINIKKSLFNEYNCRGCPIMNHREVSLTANKDKQCIWKIIGGIIYQANTEDEKDHIDYKLNNSADL